MAKFGPYSTLVTQLAYSKQFAAAFDYVAEMLRTRKIKVSRIARGVPLGGELEYVDAGTISQALLERREI